MAGEHQADTPTVEGTTSAGVTADEKEPSEIAHVASDLQK